MIAPIVAGALTPNVSKTLNLINRKYCKQIAMHIGNPYPTYMYTQIVQSPNQGHQLIKCFIMQAFYKMYYNYNVFHNDIFKTYN